MLKDMEDIARKSTAIMHLPDNIKAGMRDIFDTEKGQSTNDWSRLGNAWDDVEWSFKLNVLKPEREEAAD